MTMKPDAGELLDFLRGVDGLLRYQNRAALKPMQFSITEKDGVALTALRELVSNQPKVDALVDEAEVVLNSIDIMGMDSRILNTKRLRKCLAALAQERT
jgi:hypothetical protein